MFSYDSFLTKVDRVGSTSAEASKESLLKSVKSFDKGEIPLADIDLFQKQSGLTKLAYSCGEKMVSLHKQLAVDIIKSNR